MEKITDARENLIRLMKQYQNLVFSICLKLTGDYFTAEDLTQDTFILAYKNWENFDGINEKAWICRIATNKCIDYKRAAARRVVPVEDEVMIQIPDRQDFTHEIVNREIISVLETEIDQLEDPYRIVARKHFIHGKTAREISTEMDVGIKTIQTQIYRARSKLKNRIRKEELIT